ncbi:MAG: hypothetical protein AB1938_28165 [Myxococcota bacterium]
MLLSLVLAAAPATFVSPCIDEVTVRDGPSVASKRLGVLRRGASVELLSLSEEAQALTLTVDRNVPAPITFTPRDAWLRVKLPADAGVDAGWVFGGVMCRPNLMKEGWLALVGWSQDDSKVAYLERATDSFACGWGRPTALRIADVTTGQVLDSLEDGCPPADLLISHRQEVDALLQKHGVGLYWFVMEGERGTLKAVLSGPQCQQGRCTLRLSEKPGAVGREASVDFTHDPRALDSSFGVPRASVVAVLRRPGTEVAFVRLASSEEHHTFRPVRLGQGAPWRDALPGLKLTGTPRSFGRCKGLEADATGPDARKRLEQLNAELDRRMERRYGELFDRDACLVSADLAGAALEVVLTPSNCVGNECPGDACKAATRFTIGRNLAITAEKSVRLEEYSCDP